MYRTVFRVSSILIECAAAKQACFLTIGMFSSAKPTGALNYFGPVCHNAADDDAGVFLDNEMVSVEKCNNGVWGFLYADNMVRIDVHLLFVHAGQQYHKGSSRTTIHYKY